MTMVTDKHRYMADLYLLRFGLDAENKGLQAYVTTENPDRYIDCVVITDGIGILIADHVHGSQLRLSCPVWDFNSKCNATTIVGRHDKRNNAYRQTPATIDKVEAILPLFRPERHQDLMKGLPFIIIGKHGIYKDFTEFRKAVSQQYALTRVGRYIKGRNIEGKDIPAMIDAELKRKDIPAMKDPEW